ncbi:PhzF family phenazine biosynthesis protein [Dysgonomonas sp. Marseille-P4677]|uniref:PhzF family phenazine biosynthesis protein n=1 Tax=Dysgonomonas sp. Marseille-P4677 TaxID=2364790 RepID=UPI0019145499|nr:PhzF family phenazine biosynthesis protein [Dysgonomonas sp. Marseille-P4677]MBK5722674.1 PhzF family phenazine biosynthesis protein [Dysgonomonas sp. Marseille-P4677]
MKKYKLYQVDAFTEKLFGGNPAAVCPLNEWLDDNLLQKIAMENNLAETAFYVKRDNRYEIRWFTPNVEVDLCGHATLATAYVLFCHENHKENIIIFHSPRSGELIVSKKADGLTLDFPIDEFCETPISSEITNCFDKKPVEAYKGKTDYMLVYEKETDITDIQPQFGDIAKLKARGVIITARGETVDFVSRFFAPQSGIIEDPVTGSAHTTLTPYWAKKLNKTELSAVQLSERKGYLQCKHTEERVEISGQAKLYMKGEIFI